MFLIFNLIITVQNVGMRIFVALQTTLNNNPNAYALIPDEEIIVKLICVRNVKTGDLAEWIMMVMESSVSVHDRSMENIAKLKHVRIVRMVEIVKTALEKTNLIVFAHFHLLGHIVN